MWTEHTLGGAVSTFPGYVVVDFTCPGCGYKWIGACAVGVQGVTCPDCGLDDPKFVWPNDAPFDMPHDGCWLTGETDLFEFAPDEDDDEDAGPVVVETVRPPWPIRMLAIIVGWWFVRQARKEKG